MSWNSKLLSNQNRLYRIGRKRLILLLLVGLWIFVTPWLGQSVAFAESQQQRIEDLEEAVQSIEERIGSRSVVQGFDAEKLTIGGFLHSTLTTVDGEDSTATSFNRLIFELLVKAELTERWSAFIAQAFIRESDIVYTDPEMRRDPSFSVQGKTPLVIAWANHEFSNALNLQFGKFITPHGIINIEHFPAILLDTEQPQFLRPFSGQTIFPNFVTGVQTHGRAFVGNNDSNTLQYNLYAANFSGADEEIVIGARSAYTWASSGITVGLNASNGDRDENLESEYSMYGVDLLIDKGKLLWKNEVFSTDEDMGRDRKAYYTQPAWRFTPKVTVFYRYDFLDNGDTSGDTIENMLGLNYTPRPNIRLRATLTDKEFEAGMTERPADALIYQISATLSF